MFFSGWSSTFLARRVSVYRSLPDTCLDYMAEPVYTNSLLAVLNVRHFVLESKRSKFPSFKSAIPLSRINKRPQAVYVHSACSVHGLC